MMHTNPWMVTAEKMVYENPWIRLTEFDVINPGGGKGIYGTVHFKNLAVGAIVLDEERNTYPVGQYRFPTNVFSWEIPEGGAPEGTDPLENVQRELKEETGLVAAHWQPLLQMHLSNSVSDELAIIFLAMDLKQQDAEPEETEKLVIKKIPFDEAYRMVDEGVITDSMSVAAILKVKILFAEGKLK
ncbi:MAG: NUDIX hydrolase [Sediminibacterium sp.]|nr:NUDIX hydrolase [Sediminibacterium sp.]MDP3127274.1 NUDIX hydrolase [Sediminibacterium sp.]